LEGDLVLLRSDRICQAKTNAVADAQSAWSHLQDTPYFFADCQFGFCLSGGDMGVVGDAEGEEARENFHPLCVKDDGSRDPASACRNTFCDQATLSLDNVVQNNMYRTDAGEKKSALVER